MSDGREETRSSGGRIPRRRRRCGGGLSLLVALALSGCARPAKILFEPEQLSRSGYVKHWTAKLPMSKDDGVRAAYLVDDNLYVITKLGFVLAVNPDVGMVRWAAYLARPIEHIFEPTHLATADDGGPVVFVTSTRVIVCDRYSGDVLKQVGLEFAPSCAAVGDAERLFVGSNDGHVYSLIWNTALDRLVEVWRVRVGAAVAATPARWETDGLIFAARNGSVYSCTASHKVGQWEFRTDGPVVAKPYVDPSGAYVSSTDRSVYRLDLASGLAHWRCRLPEPLTDDPVVARQTLYQYSNHDGLYALDMERGRVLWHSPNGRCFVSRGEKEVCVLTDNRQLQVLDAQSGKELHRFDVPGADFVAANPRDAAMFLLSGDGQALCAVPGDVPYIRREQAIIARRTLTLPPGAAATRPGRDAGLNAQPPAERPVDPLQSARP